MDPLTGVLNILKDKEKLVSFDENSEAYVWNKPFKRLKGSSKNAKKRFHPWYTKPVGKSKSARIQTSKKVAKGRKGGKLVHAELQQYTEATRQGKEYIDLDPRTQAIIAEVKKRGWFIYAGEYCVGDRELGFGTGIDLLCLTYSGEPVLIEIKCGYDNVLYSSHSKKRMKAPFNRLDDSPYCQHQLQLLGNVGLFEKMTGLTAKHAEVWVVGNPRGNFKSCPIKAWPLHPEITDMSTKLLDLLAHPPAESKKRYYVKLNEEKPKKKQKL